MGLFGLEILKLAIQAPPRTPHLPKYHVSEIKEGTNKNHGVGARRWRMTAMESVNARPVQDAGEKQMRGIGEEL